MTAMPARCATVREAVSSRLDGEEHPLSVDAVRRHLAGCADCDRFQAQLAEVARRTRVAAAEPVPDLTAAILTTLATEPAPVAGRAARRMRSLRLLVALAGVAQLALAVPALLGVVGPDLHLGRDLGALQLAVGVGLVVTAWQPRRAPGVLPVLLVLTVTTLITAVLDVATGSASLTAELTHLTKLVGVGALWSLTRRLPDRPRLRTAVAA